MNWYRTWFGLIVLALLAGCKGETNNTENNKVMESYKTIGEIRRIDAAMDQLIPDDSQIEILAEGFVWSEGPLWVEDGQYLLFSDIPPNSIFKWKEGEGHSLYLKPSGYTGNVERSGEPGSNGLLLNDEGQLVLCQHGDRRMAVMNATLDNPSPDFRTLTDKYDGMRYNSPNDAVFHSNGDLYFTDPPYGLEQNVNDPAKEIPFQGVYRLGSDGESHLLTDQMTRPNGIAFSPDEKTLYVANSDPEIPVIMAYGLNEDGSVKEGKVFADTKDLMVDGAKGLPDGMKVDNGGNLYATGPGGVLVYNKEGKHLGTISSGEATSNVALDLKGGYLYATSDMYLIRVKLTSN